MTLDDKQLIAAARSMADEVAKIFETQPIDVVMLALSMLVADGMKMSEVQARRTGVQWNYESAMAIHLAVVEGVLQGAIK